MNDSPEEDANWKEKQWKNFHSKQKKIEMLNELLFTIDQWKAKLSVSNSSL